MNHLEFLPKENINIYVVECTAEIHDKDSYFYQMKFSNFTILNL